MPAPKGPLRRGGPGPGLPAGGLSLARIVPAILTEKPEELEALVRQAEGFADYVQVDIMDGLFVPSRSIAAADLARVRPRLPWEAHLMVRDPESHLSAYKEAGAEKAILHYEATPSPAQAIAQGRSLGLKVGLAANPETPVAALLPFIPLVDSVLFLSVQPGFYGAAFIPEVLDKVRELRQAHPTLEIGVDGGIKAENLIEVARAGADTLCVGSAIFRHPHPAQSYRHLQALAQASQI